MTIASTCFSSLTIQVQMQRIGSKQLQLYTTSCLVSTTKNIYNFYVKCYVHTK